MRRLLERLTRCAEKCVVTILNFVVCSPCQLKVLTRIPVLADKQKN